MKAVKSTKRKAVESDNDSEVAAPKSKKAKPTSKAASKTDNEPFWDVSIPHLLYAEPFSCVVTTNRIEYKRSL